MKRIGFIGLGIMGRPMALNILRSGFEVLVVAGHARAAMEEAVSHGAQMFCNAAELGARADAVLLCLPDTQVVEEVVTGEGGVLAGAKPGLIVADHSTISPTVTQELARTCGEKGVFFVDAPVSGGDTGAKAGTLSIMAGGEAEAVEKLRPVFESEGKAITHVGTSGAGQFAKCCNQIICAVTWQAIAEGMALGAKAGVDPARMLEAVSGGAAGCWALSNRMPRVLEGDFEPGFMAKLQLKDLEIARDAARALGVPLPAAGLVTSLYTALVAAGGGERDTSAVVTVEEGLAGAEIRRKPLRENVLE
jgi:3-hydroxyisobutyrate dehydrogenase-like beta-hydroxyacid dehydrogenase